jgi:hypothetical protein
MVDYNKKKLFGFYIIYFSSLIFFCFNNFILWWLIVLDLSLRSFSSLFYIWPSENFIGQVIDFIEKKITIKTDLVYVCWASFSSLLIL